MARWSMFFNSVSRRFVQASVALALAGLVPASRSSQAEEKAAAKLQPVRNLEVGNTKPVNLRPLEAHFQTPGLIKRVYVKKGDAVKAGQLLMALDDATELAELEVRTKDANDAKVKAAEVNALAKQAKFKRIKALHDDNSAQNDAEFEEVTAEKDLAVLQIASEKQDLEVKKSRVAQQKVKIGQLSLLSPMDGIVQSVDMYAGEMGDPTKAAVKIVNNNPLVIMVDLPTATSLQMKVGQPIRVSYDKNDWKQAKVSYLAPMANAGAGMQTVHLDLSNIEGQVSGLQIYVELPEAQLAGH